MVSVRRILGLGLLVVAVGVGIWAWRSATRIPQDDKAYDFTVAATIFPLADIVKQVAGENVKVVVIIPPGVSEHSSALTPRQLTALQEARVVFQVGHGLDDHAVEKILEAVPGIQPVVVDQGIQLREFAMSEPVEGHADEEDHPRDEGVDPHYWLTMPNAMKIARTIAEELTKLDPERASAYAERLAAYERQLAEIEKELQAKVASASPKEFIAMHNAWSYFADQYGFTLVATYEPREGQEPSLQDLQRIQQLVQQYGITTFYTEPQKSTAAVTQFMQREFGLQVSALDPIGGLPGRESYISLMKANIAAIANGP